MGGRKSLIMTSLHLPWRIITAGIIALLTFAVLAPLAAAPDLDVVYISRAPRYDRYYVDYTGKFDPNDPDTTKPSLSAAEQAKKRWPERGETVTFTAVVRNPGDAATGQFEYKWYFDGKEVASGTLPSIEPGAEAKTTYSWVWDSEQDTHLIKFVADPDNKIAEDIEANNSIEDPTNALCFSFYVWQGLYDWFKVEARKTNPNIACFEDLAQQQVFHMNRMFKEAVYPCAPKGILERVRLDQIIVVPDDTPDPESWATHAPEDIWADGRRGFTTKEYLPIFKEDLSVLNGYMPSCIHELSHQLGMIDIYQFNIEGGTHVGNKNGMDNSRGGGMMNNCGTYYEDITACAFNNNLHKRRGYFGEYLYDLPKTCKVRILDAYGRPIPNADLKFYQDKYKEFNDPPTFTGKTDSKGCFTMPNRTCFGETTTATGHKLRDNPWGLINVVGFNGIFYIAVTVNSQTDYQFVEIAPFNIAYNAGHKDSWTYEMQTCIIPEGKVTRSDLYGVKMLSKTLGYAVGSAGTILKWDGKAWTPMPSPTDKTLRAVEAVAGGKMACAVGDGGTILILSGKNWTQKNAGTEKDLKTCVVVSAKTILVGGEAGELYRSADAGNTWGKIETTKDNIVRMAFNGQNGVMVTNGKFGRYTTDGGATWQESENELKYGYIVTDCCMSSPTEAWCINKNGDLHKSADGGKTWKPIDSFSRAAEPSGLAIAAGPYGWIVTTSHQWCGGGSAVYRINKIRPAKQPITSSGDMCDFYDVSLVSDDEAWAVGKGGLIVRLDPARVK
jgi:photosystem II stability/assembly factor-like uncharacterized protein